MRRRNPVFLLLLMFLVAVYPQFLQAGNLILTIGTGAKEGVYYPTGKAIAQVVNARQQQQSFSLRVESTGGSVFNINAIMAGDLELGIVQSDRQFQAWNGLKDWKERGRQEKLRSICSFHPESVVLVAGDDTGIEQLSDLIGKHINIGNPGSGPRGNAIDVMQACDINWRRSINAEGFRASRSPQLLADRSIDAFFYTVGHPNDSIQQAVTGERKVHFVPLTGVCVDKLVEKWPYYARAEIPIQFYPNARNTENVKTFGVKATFCTNADIPESAVYAVTKIIFENLQEFKTLHPAYGALTADNMLEALTAPIHPGALKYYREKGLKVPE